MAGQYVPIGGRLTYLPPFVNERFDGPPYWACTYAALLNGANVAWLGRKPATHTEVAALAGASGDTDTRGGSRSRHMIRAVRVRYRRDVGLDNVGSDEAQRRLAAGWALVAGVTYGELPARYRRWSPRFKLGHRVTVVGFSSGRTRLLDPLANEGTAYAGEWIAWSDFVQAWWSDEQLWFREGAYLDQDSAAGPARAPRAKPPVAPGGQPAIGPAIAAGVAPPPVARILRRYEPARHFRVAAGTTVVAFVAGNPPTVARRLTFSHASGAMFDALVTFDPNVMAPGDPGRTFLRITKGAFVRRYIEAGARGIVADLEPAPEAAPAIASSTAPDGPVIAAAVLEGRRSEWDRISLATAGRIVLPPRP
jgi:hypothetical protein